MGEIVGGIVFGVLVLAVFVFGFTQGGGYADQRVCAILATERGDTLAIATEVPECRDHLMDLYMDAREPTP